MLCCDKEAGIHYRTEHPANQAADRSGEVNHRLAPSPNIGRGAAERIFKLGGSDEHRMVGSRAYAGPAIDQSHEGEGKGALASSEARIISKCARGS
jgi:hypothetical protein